MTKSESMRGLLNQLNEVERDRWWPKKDPIYWKGYFLIVDKDAVTAYLVNSRYAENLVDAIHSDTLGLMNHGFDLDVASNVLEFFDIRESEWSQTSKRGTYYETTVDGYLLDDGDVQALLDVGIKPINIWDDDEWDT